MNSSVKSGLGSVIGIALCIAILFGIVVGGVAGCGAYKGWQRGQQRADAQNQVQITHIRIQQAQQQAKVVAANDATIQAQAYQRYLEAVGVRRAQDEIAKTLTPQYNQYEMIKALQAVATSGQNNTVVYIPSGAGGVPSVTGSPLALTAQVGRGK